MPAKPHIDTTSHKNPLKKKLPPRPYPPKHPWGKTTQQLTDPKKRPPLQKPLRQPFNRPPIPSHPLPMTSQPVIGLPQVPPSRKQTPFHAKKPLQPPKLPSYHPHQIHPQPPSRPLARPLHHNKKHHGKTAINTRILIKPKPLKKLPPVKNTQIKPGNIRMC